MYSDGMSNISITPVPMQLSIRLRPGKITLPDDLHQKVVAHWAELTAANPALHNGEVFSVVSEQNSGSELKLELQQTDYAHHLYNKHIGRLGEYGVKIIHPCAIILTADGQMVFGAMGNQTSSPGEILCCGGGIDFDDVTGKTVHIEHTISKELSEELAINVNDPGQVQSFEPKYLISNEDLHISTVVYVVQLQQTATAFQEQYRQFVNDIRGQGELPEFGKLYYLTPSPDKVEHFIQGHEATLGKYMATLLHAMC